MLIIKHLKIYKKIFLFDKSALLSDYLQNMQKICK